uniref:Chemokine interleukin-8-like domain-containing protein n=1 Tax=Knipowitschia caucasica TaxID=637954 RepID=A0AAV2JQ83_KNICA
MCCRKLALFAILAGVLIIVVGATDEKIIKCCTRVSIANVTAPILGYRIQRKNLPCIRAVIFKTTEGEICSHLKQDWVRSKIMELGQSHQAKMNAI